MADSLSQTPFRRSDWPAWTLIAVIALLPFGRLSVAPVLILGIAGIVALIQQREHLLQDRAIRLYTIFFACFWIPTILSALDSVQPSKSWSTALGLLRFLPMGWFAIVSLKDDRLRRIVLLGSATIVLYWVVDALLQAVVGFNTLGMPQSSERLNGIFGETNIKLGPVLAVLAPVLLEASRRYLGVRWFLLVFALLLSAILLIGTRAAWVMFVIVTISYLYLYARHNPKLGLQAAVVIAAFALLIGSIGYQFSPSFQQRVDRSLLALEGDTEALDIALSQRLPIWRTALTMASENPINGIGVRSFRYAYPEYAEEGDPWVNPASNTGAAHAHQIGLELLSETGLIGLLGLIVGGVFAARYWLQCSWRQRQAQLPYALALLAMLFPLNTHLAFYSTFWSLLCWWLIMMFCATGQAKTR